MHPRPARRPALLAALLIVLTLPLSMASRPAHAAPGTTAGIGSWNRKVLPFRAVDVANDPFRDTVLATVPSRQPELGNELVEVDPFTGAISRHVFVGSDPEHIALTDDGTMAYVTLRGSLRIAHVDLVSFTVLSSFSTAVEEGRWPEGVTDIVTVPGRSDTVLVAFGQHNHHGVFAYRAGVALPDHVSSFDSYARRLVVADADTAYGYDDRLSSHELATYALDDAGVRLVRSEESALEGSGAIELAAGLLYGGSGLVVDPATYQGVGSFAASGIVEVTGDRVTFLDGESVQRFRVFDRTTGVSLGTRTFESAFPYDDRDRHYNTEMVATSAGFAVAGTRALMLFGPSVGGGEVGLPAVPESSIAMLQSTVVDIDVAGMVYDSTRQVLYVSDSKRYDSYSRNRVLAVDPTTGQVVRALTFATEPTRLALSHDHSRLHVALGLNNDLGQGPRVAEIDLATFTVTGGFEVRIDDQWRLDITDLALMPGTRDVVAVSIPGCCGPRGVAVYDGGVRRTETHGEHPIPGGLAFDGPSTLYGLAGDTLVHMAVDPSGVSVVAKHEYIDVGHGPDSRMIGGRLYSGVGTILDPRALERVGRLPDGPGDVLPERNRAFVMGGWPSASGLLELDLARMRPISTRAFGVPGDGNHLVSTGSGLAIGYTGSTFPGKLQLLHPPGAPTIDRLVRPSGSTNGGWPVRIEGSGFTGATSVTFGGVPAESFEVGSGETIRAFPPPHRPGPVAVKVTTPTGSNGASAAATFTYEATPPDLGSVTPSTGPLAGGTAVRLAGYSLRSTTSVTFGGRPAAFTIEGDQVVHAVSPPGAAAGSVPVVVTTTGGSNTAERASEHFTYSPGMVALPPARLLDTRAGAGKIGYAGAKPVPGQVVQVQVAGRGGVPASGVGAVVLNVTATEAAGSGFVSAWPCGLPWPGTSTLNLEGAGHTVANAAVLGLGSGGTVCLASSTAVHLIVDVSGWSSTGAGLSTVPPGRILETRAAAGQVGYAGGRPVAGQIVQVPVAGRAGVPASGVGSVTLNVTATDAAGAGFVTAWPCGTPPPGTSTLNLERAGHTVANLAVAGVGAGGAVCLASSTAVHLIADVTAWSPAGAGFVTAPPSRLLETRLAAGQVAYTGSRPAAGQVVQVPVAGRGGVPLTGVGIVALNVTATGAAGAGYVTAWPCGQAQPATSTLNLERAGHTVANLAIVGVGSGGRVCLYTSVGTHLIADVTGWSAS